MTQTSSHASLRLTARLCTAAAIVLSLTALIGWFIGERILTGVRPEFIPMAPNTALLFILLGSGLFVSTTNSRWRFWFPRVSALAVLVRRIIHRHGGETWAVGALDQGATFYFSLPVRQAPNA